MSLSLIIILNLQTNPIIRIYLAMLLGLGIALTIRQYEASRNPMYLKKRRTCSSTVVFYSLRSLSTRNLVMKHFFFITKVAH